MSGNQLEVSMYRYNPEQDKFPYMKKYKIDKSYCSPMLITKDGSYVQ